MGPLGLALRPRYLTLSTRCPDGIRSLISRSTNRMLLKSPTPMLKLWSQEPDVHFSLVLVAVRVVPKLTKRVTPFILAPNEGEGDPSFDMAAPAAQIYAARARQGSVIRVSLRGDCAPGRCEGTVARIDSSRAGASARPIVCAKHVASYGVSAATELRARVAHNRNHDLISDLIDFAI